MNLIVIYDDEKTIELIKPRTKYVGCAAVYNGNSGNLFLCYYAPSVKAENNSIEFLQGTPNSKCDGQESLHEYKYLYGSIRNLLQDKFAAPFKISESFINIGSYLLDIYILVINQLIK